MHFFAKKVLQFQKKSDKKTEKPPTCTAPNCADSTKKAHYGREIKNSSKELTSQFKRSQFCFKLNSLMVVKIDVSINEKTSFLKSLKFYAVNTFSFENGKEIFSQSIVIRISAS